VIERFVHALPTTHEHRATLVTAGFLQQTKDDVERRLSALPRSQRRDLVRRLAGSATSAVRDEARERWRALGRDLGVTSEELDRFAEA
jgi:hypothetical protein